MWSMVALLPYPLQYLGVVHSMILGHDALGCYIFVWSICVGMGVFLKKHSNNTKKRHVF